ncbi:MAG TPA: S8 family peptidase [Ignavibacteriaceae bacterium]|nr:S8 family peptidase [Ignavibacteriaceae bacterium]
MKKIILLLIVLVSVGCFAQSAGQKISDKLNVVLQNSGADDEILIWVFFSDKGENLEAYFTNPTSVVSEKSLLRRAKVLSENKLITQTDFPVNQNYITQIESAGFKLKQKTKWFNGVSGWVTKSELAQIAELQFVKQLDIVYRFRTDNLDSEFMNNEQGNSGQDLLKPEEVHSFNYGQSFIQLNQITIPQVHDLGYTGAGVTICMMDAGFDLLSHQVFSTMNIIATWDFVNGDPDVENGSDMGDGSHGTATLSLIGGFFEGQLIGPAFGADFILAKTENTDSETPIEEDNWIAALEWADSIGVDVTSTSLGYLDFDPPGPGPEDYTWQDMDGNTARITIGADLAVGLGIFVVNSAGNGGFVSAPENTLGAPADGDSVVAAGSVNSSGSRSGFSSVGPTFDGRIKPDLMAMGSNDYHACNSFNSCYNNGSGTSYSCPLLAGASALLLEVDPSLTPMQLLGLLRNHASQSSNPDRLMGWGIINTYETVQELVTSADNNIQPEDYYVLTNYPNPFNPSTKIQFAVSQKSEVKLTLHNLLGQEIKVLFNDEVEFGLHEYQLNSDNLSSGVYFVRMVTSGFTKSLKISLLK